MSLAELKTKNLRWINITNTSKGEIDFLRNNFSFHPLNLEDCLIFGQRPKLEKGPDYYFLVLLFPVYNRKTREIEPSEIDFFIGPDYFITLHDDKLSPIKNLYNHCQTDSENKNQLFSQGPFHFLYELLNKLLTYCYPMLDHLSIDVRTIEKKIFTGSERTILSEILIIRRNITDFRKIMQAHKNTIKKLTNIVRVIEPSSEKLAVYYNDLVELTKEIWDHLETYKESIETLHQTNESMISNRLNDIMKTFTTMSVIIFSMTLVATTFSIKAKDTPVINYPWAFWLILVILFIVATGMWQFFKKRKLL